MQQEQMENILREENVNLESYTDNAVYQCEICNQYFTGKVNFNRHFISAGKSAIGGEKIGSICKDFTCNQSISIQHPYYLCHLCSVLFPYFEDIGKFLADEYKTKKAFTCIGCRRSFKSNCISSTNATIGRYILTPYNCRSCNITFSNLLCFAMHINGIHFQSGHIFCPACGKTFTQKSDLISHSKEHGRML